MIRMQSTPVRYDNVQLLGGLDQVTPNLSLVPELQGMKDSMEEQDQVMQVIQP